MKVLLAVDGSVYTHKMLAYLVTHPELFNTDHRYTLLNVQVPIPARARSVIGKDTLAQYHQEDSEKVLSPVSVFLARHGINAKSIAKVGHAGEIIAKAADTGKFDLLVMGSHGHATLGGLVMGSVATQVLAHCKVPLLLVR